MSNNSEDTSIIADEKGEVGKSPIDYYTWGHICMGIASFLLLSLIIIIPQYVVVSVPFLLPWWLIIILVLGVALVWELLENTIFISWGFKFEGRRDSWLNALTDILFVIIGGLYMWLMEWIIIELLLLALVWFYLVGIVSFCISLTGFVIGFLIME